MYQLKFVQHQFWRFTVTKRYCKLRIKCLEQEDPVSVLVDLLVIESMYIDKGESTNGLSSRSYLL